MADFPPQGSGNVTDTGAGSHVTLFPTAYNTTNGTWSISTSGTDFFNIFGTNTTAADADFMTFEVYLSAGTYTLIFYNFHNSNNGIADVQIDGVEVASFDKYASSGSGNNRDSQTGITVSSSGLKTVKLVVDGKNASSSGYQCPFNCLIFWRTA